MEEKKVTFVEFCKEHPELMKGVKDLALLGLGLGVGYIFGFKAGVSINTIKFYRF